MHNKPIALVILDGFGISTHDAGNPVTHAQLPHLTRWMQAMPTTTLAASGTAVGLPAGYVGNSEVGHLTIGAGRIVTQSVTLLNNAIKDQSFFANPILIKTLQECMQHKKNLHIVGILSDAGINGNQEHIVAYAKAAHEEGIQRIYIHAILDGRDTLPHTALERIDALIAATKKYNAQIVTLHGRFYAMDRNKNYERTVKTYHILVDQDTPISTSWRQSLETQTSSEEFFEPIRIASVGYITDGDTILFTSCRADRMRQLVTALSGDTRIIGKAPQVGNLILVAPVPYGKYIPITPLYPRINVHHTLKEVLCTHHCSVMSIAETEKYAHVTYFFNSEREDVLPCEIRHLIPSIRVKNYINNPEMSAAEITNTMLRSLAKDPKDFYLINYANADMVGHTGDFNATVKALEWLDRELGRLNEVLVTEMDGTLFITSDHGNAEQKIDPATGKPSPTHTTNPVPFIVVTQQPLDKALVAEMHGLADIAPFILHYMGIPVPAEMTGNPIKAKS